MRVIVRVRPQSELTSSTDNLPKDKELESNTDSANNQTITVESDQKQISVYRERKGHAAFSFSNVLDTSSSQETLYDLCKDSVGDVMSGVNCSILAYGQTGSGKTYSMLGKGIEEGATQGLGSTRELSATTGSDDDNQTSTAHPQLTSEFIGIVPRCIGDMFEWIDNKMKSNANNNSSLDYSITANYLQIYNEKLFDLLQDRQLKNALQLRDAEKGAYSSVYVQGLSEYRVRSKDEVLALLLKGLRNRATRATEMNNESSRSHTILQLFVQVHGFDGETGMPVLQRSTYSFVDLAGSEKWRSSLTQAGNSQLDVQKEMTNINTSLHALGNCVSALIEPGRKHIPYRDSLLTRLLRDSLGGENDGGARGKSVLIATIREDSSMVDETYSTLQFASRASKIKTIIKPATSDFLQFQSTGNMTLERAKKEISLLREHISHLEGAHLKKIEAANNPVSKGNTSSNPVIVAATSATLAERGADVTSLCSKIANILATREAEQHDDVLTTEVLQQCQIQLNELFKLCSDVATAAAASSHRPAQTHTDPNSGYASDSSQSSLSKQRRDITGSGVPPKPKKKSKKAAGGLTPQKPLVTPSKQKQQPEQGTTISKVKRKAASANAALVDKGSLLNKKSSKKDKEGISLPLLKSNSAGTYGKQSTSRTVQASGIARQAQLKEEVQRQKKLTKKKLNLDGQSGGGGLTTMKKLNRTQKKLITNQATHNNRYDHDDNEDDALNDDLLGIINDESDGNADDDDDDEDNDDEIMRRIEMENMKIIQAEDLAMERELAKEKAKNAQLKQHEAANIARQSHSRSKLRSRERQQYPQDSMGGGETTITPRDNSIESILAASRNAVLAANGALDHGGSPQRQNTNNHNSVEDGTALASGRSPARQSIEEERGLVHYRPQHDHGQHQQAPPQQQQQQYHHEQVMAPAPSHYQATPTIAAPNYNINTSYSNLNTGLMMPPSSMDNGSVGFGNKCGKHGLESCVLCTMFNAPPASVKSIQYNGTGGGAGFPTAQNSTGPLSRSIHSPIKSTDELGNSSTGKEMTTPVARVTPTVPSPLETVSGFCAVHHVNDCLLCSLTSQRRSINAPPSGYNISSSSPGRQHASSSSATPHPNSVTAGSPGIGFTQQNNATPSYTGYGNTPVANAVAGLSSVGGGAGGPNSNTTAPGMFTASPNKQHSFNGYNNSVSLASKDGVYAFSKNDSSTTVIPKTTNSSNVVAAQHIPGHSVPSPSASGPGAGSGSFRSRYPVKSNPISEENEQDLDGTGSTRESRSSVDMQQIHTQPNVGNASPHRHHVGSTPSVHADHHVHFSLPSSERVGGGSSDKPRHSSAEEFEALLNSMSSKTQQKTEAIPSKYSNLPKGGGIQFEDESDDIAPVSGRGHDMSHGRSSKDSDGIGGAVAAVRTDHRRGNAMHRNAQSGLYEYDYRSKVEYKDDQEENRPVQKQKPPEQHVTKPKSKPHQLSGAAASAASAYGSDMSKLVSTDGGKKAKKKQMNRKLFEMQKNKNK